MKKHRILSVLLAIAPLMGSMPMTALAADAALIDDGNGGVSFAGVSLYEIEHWPLLLADAAHYVCCMIVFIPIAFFLGWTETVGETVIMALVLLAVHSVISLVMCACCRAGVRELNEWRKAQYQQQIGGAI